ncbi:MAG: MmgE/PrpD family protein [Rhodobacteraceae bacterium]|nr:MmgE/PrpD family protein [Paracoccaceae bacterium]MBR9820693.1 MmgE/PrpD family protein [Paracoccaceae bacterium]
MDQAAEISSRDDQTPYEIVAELARYIGQARDAAVPAVAKDAALQCIFDLIVASIVGFNDPGPTSLRQAAKGLFAPGNATIWFAGQTCNAIGAAWANSSAAAAKDLDDGNRFAAGHPGAAIIPAALATAQEVGATLDQTLAAIVLGYEVAVTVGSARTTYGSSGTWTPFGVVAAVAALRGTSLGAIEHALAIVGESAPNQSFAGGPSPRIPHPEGASVKEGIPWGVVTGMTAVLMAEAGHTGPRNILDSRRHYVFPEDLRLGAALHICQTYFKPYACCRHIHAPLAALHRVMADHGISGAEIDAIHVETHPPALRISNKADPENLVDVQYSIPFDLALSALHGPEMLTPVTEASLSLPGVRELARKVTLEVNDAFAAAYPDEILGRVTLTCGDRVLTSAPTPPEGEPLMSWQELDTKFRRATRLDLKMDRQQAILDAMTSLKAGEMRPLLSQLATPL